MTFRKIYIFRVFEKVMANEDLVERIRRIAEVENIREEDLSLENARTFLREHVDHIRDNYSVALEYDSEKRLTSIGIGLECFEDIEARLLGDGAYTESSCKVYYRPQ